MKDRLPASIFYSSNLNLNSLTYSILRVITSPAVRLSIIELENVPTIISVGTAAELTSTPLTAMVTVASILLLIEIL